MIRRFYDVFFPKVAKVPALKSTCLILFLALQSLASCFATENQNVVTANAKAQGTLHATAEITDIESLISRLEQNEIEILSQRKEINHLRDELSYSLQEKGSGMKFEVWAGLLLASSALLLTIVGVGIALLSIFGYKKIINISTTVAEDTARKISTETSFQMVPDATTRELIRLMDDKKFDPIISKAVEAFLYRGVTPFSDED
jgi:hypothetical protein